MELSCPRVELEFSGPRGGVIKFSISRSGVRVQ